MRRIRYFLRQLRRVAEWLPVIWENGDYDFACNLDIFRYSLERTARHIRKHHFIMDADKVANQIEDVVMMIRAYQNDDWFDDARRRHREKWGETQMVSFPVPGHEGVLSQTDFYYDRADTLDKHLQADEEFDFSATVDREHEIWKKIWRRISQQMEGWWD